MTEMKRVKVTLEVTVEVPVSVDPSDIVVTSPSTFWLSSEPTHRDYFTVIENDQISEEELEFGVDYFN